MRLLDASTLVAALLLAGCASTDCERPTGNPAVTPAEVAATGGHTGELVRWGGTIAAASNLKDQTEIEVVGYPLDRCGRPESGAEPVGRFVVIHSGYLETADYRPGSQVSVAGLVTGTREGSVGGASYVFPLVQSRDIRLLDDTDSASGNRRPWVTIGIGGGSGGVGGGIGVLF